MTKTFWISSVIILILIAVGIYVYAINTQAPVPVTSITSTTTIISTTTTTTEPPAPGMQQYTDTDFGFTFWYPNSLQVTSTNTDDTTMFPGGTLVKTLQIGPAGGVTIYVVNSPNQTITDEQNGHASPIAQTKYFYDLATQQWMVAYPEGTESGTSGATTTANVSNTTTSGLIMLSSGRRFDTSIIPLSATRFLVVSDGGGGDASAIAKTVSLVGVSVSPLPAIQQLNASGSVSLEQGGIAEIRNENFYFTLQSLSSAQATIQITPVGCWNSFPSDPPPQIRCMLAVVPIPPQSLSVGQTYSAANYSITLTQMSASTATFSVGASSSNL